MTTVGRRLAPLALTSLLILGGAAAGPSGRWLGQDGHDLVASSSTPGPSGVQDLHFALDRLPTGSPIVAASVRGEGGGEWTFRGAPGSWLALVVQPPGAATADVYVEPYQIEAGRAFEIALTFDDGRSATVRVRGGRADPNLRASSSRLEARWVGQDGRDLVPSGPNAGPDGVQDVRLALDRLAPKGEVRSLLVAGPDGLRWQFGPNPESLPRAELVLDPSDPGRADLFFHPTRDLSGLPLTLTLTYADGRLDGATVSGGPCDPGLATPRRPLPTLTWLPLKATWLGQSGDEVRVSLEGLPASKVIGVDLSDGEVAGWSDRRKGDLVDALPLAFRRGADPSRAELGFPPIRDESGASMTVRLLLADGRSAVAAFPGGPCDPSQVGEGPAASSVAARPGDDLQDLARRYGTVTLAAGTYPLGRPLVLDRPVTIRSDGGAVVVFTQGAGEPSWASAIEVRAGRTTLEGLSIRFGGPVRWDRRVSYGPAVIGTAGGRPLAGLRFARLAIQGPPSSAWEESPRSLRLVEATNGAIEGNRLRSGMIEVWGGPWRIVGNGFEGTPAGTFAHAMIAAHEPHDLLIEGNRARPLDPGGKSWRWLVLTQRGANLRVANNTVEGVGPRDSDKVPHPNAPETVLTESYRLHFEGRPSGTSPDGRVVAIPTPQGGPASVGAVVAILSGPEAGHWRRVVLPLGSGAYLLDRPVALGGGAIAIGPGFVGTSFEGNAIDDRGSGVAVPFVLAGGHFGTRFVGNTTRGGGGSAVFAASSTEAPGPWGWSHAAMFGLAIEGNRFEDARDGVRLVVEHNAHARASRGRVYGSASVVGNVFDGLTIGDPGPGDAGELVVTESGNRQHGGRGGTVRTATVNGRAIRDGRLSFPAEDTRLRRDRGRRWQSPLKTSVESAGRIPGWSSACSGSAASSTTPTARPSTPCSRCSRKSSG